VAASLATNTETGIAALLRTRFTAEVVVAGPEPGRMLLAC
jgi:hypothetical protein